METLELPVLEDVEEANVAQEPKFDLAAFRLWREASRPDNSPEEDSPAAER